MRRCTQTLDSYRMPAHRTRSSGRERVRLPAATGMAETGMAIGTGAIGITTTTTTASSLSVASHSLGSGILSGTLMDTATAIRTVVITLPLTMAAATMGPVTT